jgi:dTDP-4-dehydrorhamnose 3,5-epimerase
VGSTVRRKQFTGYRLKFDRTALADAWLIELEPARDARGLFARTFDVEEFGARGLETSYPQHSISHTTRTGGLRGMHFQRAPHAEVKLVRCVSGAIWDVIIDIRPDSSTYCLWQSFELTSATGRQLYIPKGFAHGFQTLTANAEVSYLISTPYAPLSASGIRHDDPTFAIEWPLPITDMSEKDLKWPDFAK